MTTALPAKGYFGHTTEYETRSWTALDVPQSIAYADLFEPSFWRHHAGKFKPGHLIRLRRVDGEWDVMLNVVGIAQGGLAACKLSFYADEDMGDDEVWDNWRVEGPAFVWYFRGSPHVHVWVHVADSPDVKANARG